MGEMSYVNTIFFFQFFAQPFILLCAMTKRDDRSMTRREFLRSAKAPGGIHSMAGDRTLVTYRVGALPILNRILERMNLEGFLREYIEEDPRCEVSPVKANLLLVRNFICSREPIYGMGEWSARHAPEHLGLEPADIPRLNDDRVGRCLVSLFNSDFPSLVLRVVAHVIKEFQVSLDELHNDSTTITFHGRYEGAGQPSMSIGKVIHAITWGHNKDHRPDLKQLLFTLTVSSDGAVPVHFSTGNGNLTDDQTHQETWNLLRQLKGTADFLYVGDSKLATKENMAYIAGQGGRFISVLPESRAECKEFRGLVAQKAVTWTPIWEKKDEHGQVVDIYSIASQPALSADGYRLIWFFSTRKADLDAIARNNRVQRTLLALSGLRQKLLSPRTRYRQWTKIEAAVEKILNRLETADYIRFKIKRIEKESFRQARRGRPSKDTPYIRNVRLRFDLEYEVDQVKLAEDALQDGIFPLITNDKRLSDLEVLHAYKDQPMIEKRFSQLKTDMVVAPVYLKSPKRIEAFLCDYFFALLTQALVERELRRGMEKKGIECLPLYPEGRSCRAPTTSRVVDLFENVERHALFDGEELTERFVTKLSPIQKQVLDLLGMSASGYGQ